MPYSCLDGRRISIFDFHSKKSNRSRDSLFPILKFTNQKKKQKKKKEELFRFSITIPSAQELSRYSAKKRKKKMSDFSKISILEKEEEKERKKKERINGKLSTRVRRVSTNDVAVVPGNDTNTTRSQSKIRVTYDRYLPPRQVAEPADYHR